jgi:hypothetical protein
MTLGPFFGLSDRSALGAQMGMELGLFLRMGQNINKGLSLILIGAKLKF